MLHRSKGGAAVQDSAAGGTIAGVHQAQATVPRVLSEEMSMTDRFDLMALVERANGKPTVDDVQQAALDALKTAAYARKVAEQEAKLAAEKREKSLRYHASVFNKKRAGRRK